MKVLLTADTAGGVWTYAATLARELQRRDVDVTIAALGPQPPPHHAGVPVEWRQFALEWMPEPWADLAAAGEWLLELARDATPDVVHANAFAHATLAWRAPVILVAHSDVLTWWRAVHREPAPAEWARYRNVVEGGLAAADVVAAPTRSYLESLAHEVPFATPRLVVANGVAPRQPMPKEQYVAAVTRVWDEAKNVGALARVADGLPWPVRIEDRLPPHEFDELLGRAAIFSAPALYEPFGLAILHAAWRGCALVLGDIPTLRELWDGAAVFADPRDDGALGAALMQLIEDERMRAGLARRARARAARYTAERMAESYLRVYEQLRVGVAA